MNGNKSIIGGSPLRVLGKTPPAIQNLKFTEFNELGYNMLTRPEVLKGVMSNYAASKGGMMEIIDIFGAAGNGFYDTLMNVDSKYNKIKSSKNGNPFGSASWTKIDNYKFAWKGKVQKKQIVRLTRTVVDSFSTTVAQKPFRMWISSPNVTKDDIIILGDQRSQVKVLAVNETIGHETQITVKMMNGGPTTYIDQILLNKNTEISISFNQKAEAHSHGSRTEMRRGAEWYQNYMSTLRFEASATGYAANTKISSAAKETQYFELYHLDGTKEVFWMNQLEYLMMLEAWDAFNNMLFHSYPDINQEGQFVRDEKGREVISGYGFYHQCESRMRRLYNNFDFGLIEGLQDTFSRTSLEDGGTGRVDIVLATSLTNLTKIQSQFQKFFQLQPQVMFFTSNGSMSASQMKDSNLVTGIQSRFNFIETPIGRVIFAPTNIGTTPNQASLRTSDGRRWSEGTIHCFNVSDLISKDGEAQPKFELVSTNEDMFKMLRASTVATPSNGTYGSPEHVAESTVFASGGVAVYDDKCYMTLENPLPTA